MLCFLIGICYAYDAYGNLLQKEGNSENEFLYTGEQYNANTGLYYLRARYMNPSTGSFISMDSYQGSIYDPVSLHKYLYANANPVMYTDPSGYSAIAMEMGAQETRGIIAASRAYYDAVIFRIGMKIIAQLNAVSIVSNMANISSETILNIGIESTGNGTTVKNSISIEMLADMLDAVTFAYLICDSCMALDMATSICENTKTYVESIAIEITENNKKKFKGHCVYVLRDSQNSNRVSYVGRTKNPWRRRAQHRKDPRKKQMGNHGICIL